MCFGASVVFQTLQLSGKYLGGSWNCSIPGWGLGLVCDMGCHQAEDHHSIIFEAVVCCSLRSLMIGRHGSWVTTTSVFCLLIPNYSSYFPMDSFSSQLSVISNQVFTQNRPLLFPDHSKLRPSQQTSSLSILLTSLRMSMLVSLISISIPPSPL